MAAAAPLTPADLTVGRDRRLGLAWTCPACTGAGLAPPLGPVPIPVPSWSSLPLPPGWRWAVASIGEEGNRIVGVCAACARAPHPDAVGWRAGGDLTALPPSLVCPHCFAVAPVVRPLPALAGAWQDVPIPEGWAWTCTTLVGAGTDPDALVPTCPTCARLMADDVDAFHVRRCRARDLYSIAGQSLGGPRGLPVHEPTPS